MLGNLGLGDQIRFYRLMTEAEDTANGMVDGDAEQDDHTDAFRHAYWNTLRTHEFGEGWTKDSDVFNRDPTFLPGAPVPDDGRHPDERQWSGMVETTVGGRRGARLLGAICLAGFLLVSSSGCSYLRGDRVEVVGDDSATDEAFDRVRDSRQPARLGDVVDQANLPFGAWDRMYRFPASKDGEEIDSVLGADVRWVGLPGDPTGTCRFSCTKVPSPMRSSIMSHRPESAAVDTPLPARW